MIMYLILMLEEETQNISVNDWAHMKVSPMKGAMKFLKKGKLVPQYVGP